MTNWFINTASKYGMDVKVVHPAPNGGEVIYFDFPKEFNSGKKNPYFMIWTGGGQEWNKWHAEFGHWYFPKNKKESKEFPPTAAINQDMESLEEAIKDYVKRKGT